MVNGHLGLYLSTHSALCNLPHSPIFKGFSPPWFFYLLSNIHTHIQTHSQGSYLSQGYLVYRLVQAGIEPPAYQLVDDPDGLFIFTPILP